MVETARVIGAGIVAKIGSLLTEHQNEFIVCKVFVYANYDELFT